MRRIIKTPVVPVQLSREHRARLIRISTNSDHSLHRLLEEIVHVLAMVAADINPDLAHHFDTEGVNVTRRIRARAGDLQQVTGRCPKDALREMTPAGIASTEYENEWFDLRVHKAYQQQPELGVQQEEGALSGSGMGG